MSPSAVPSKGSVDGNPYGGTSFDWDEYSKHRPKYPAEVFDAVFDFHSKGRNDWSSVLDVACGPGNGPTSVLAQRFVSITCHDLNPLQLEVARQVFSGRPNIAFIEGPAEDLSQIPDGSVDMVTCFAALHWIEAPKFLREAARVLKPGGTFAAGTYWPNGESGNADINKLLGDLESRSIRRVFPPEVDLPAGRYYQEASRSHYANFDIPSDVFTHETRISWNEQSEEYWKRYSRLDRVDRRNVGGVGFNHTTQSLPSLRTKYGSPEALVAMADTLDHYDPQDSRDVARRIWDVLGEGSSLTLTHPFELILARRKEKV